MPTSSAPLHCFALILCGTCLVAGPARGDVENDTQDEPVLLAPSPLWAAMQLIPSPALAFGDHDPRFGLRWQLTPLLYAWGVHREVSPWRVFVVEPHYRQGGSVELFVSPELYFGDRVSPLLRPGVRVTLPILAGGEHLSISAGTSFQQVEGWSAVSAEVGAYILFGILGVQFSQTPTREGPLRSIVTLRLRYF